MANEIRQATANRTLGLHNMFASFGDWIWQPGATSGALNTVRHNILSALDDAILSAPPNEPQR